MICKMSEYNYFILISLIAAA